MCRGIQLSSHIHSTIPHTRAFYSRTFNPLSRAVAQDDEVPGPLQHKGRLLKGENGGDDAVDLYGGRKVPRLRGRGRHRLHRVAAAADSGRPEEDADRAHRLPREEHGRVRARPVDAAHLRRAERDGHPDELPREEEGGAPRQEGGAGQARGGAQLGAEHVVLAGRTAAGARRRAASAAGARCRSGNNDSSSCASGGCCGGAREQQRGAAAARRDSGGGGAGGGVCGRAEGDGGAGSDRGRTKRAEGSRFCRP